MGDLVFHAHSGLRYLVLLAGAAALGWALVGLIARRGEDRPGRVLGLIFVGSLDLQVVLGLLLLVARGFYPQLIGHVFLMLLAVGLGHATSVIGRRRVAAGTSPHIVAVTGYAAALAAIVLGILAIGRDVF